MTRTFCPVYVDHQWGNETTYIELLDKPVGCDIAVDRPCRLTVRWPDGTVEEVDVEIRAEANTYSGNLPGMAGPSLCPVVVRVVHGTRVDVPLSEVEADPESVVWTDKAGGAR